MYKYKILLKVTGSIAAYKSAYLISKLVQNNCEVKVVASENALKFVGIATFEGLTGNQVHTDSFASDSMISHINLVKWADLTIVCPATANTINKLANGISDSLLTSLFLAHDWTKPYLIAPAMNSLMLSHPATQESIQKLAKWGVKILPTAEGYLACKDIGKGKLLEPDEIFKIIFEVLNDKRKLNNSKNILITSGGTKEYIDGVRYISNLSTGKTASSIANHFISSGYNVTFIHSQDSVIPLSDCEKISFTSFSHLNEKIKTFLAKKHVDFIIHLAAVSDYTPVSIDAGDTSINLPAVKKLNSDEDSFTIKLKRNFKILEKLKTYSVNKRISVIGFKLTYGSTEDERTAAVHKMMKNDNVDFIVTNDLKDRTDTQVQTNFKIYDRQLDEINCLSIDELSKELEKIIREKE